MKKVGTVAEYIKSFPKPVALRLTRIRTIIRKGAPKASEAIAYGMVGYKLNGKPLIYIGAFKNHIGIFALPKTQVVFKKELEKYKTSKGTIQLPHTATFPTHLVQKIVTYRVKECRSKIR